MLEATLAGQRSPIAESARLARLAAKVGERAERMGVMGWTPDAPPAVRVALGVQQVEVLSTVLEAVQARVTPPMTGPDWTRFAHTVHRMRRELEAARATEPDES